jgi:hypothetical protein
MEVFWVQGKDAKGRAAALVRGTYHGMLYHGVDIKRF